MLSSGGDVISRMPRPTAHSRHKAGLVEIDSVGI